MTTSGATITRSPPVRFASARAPSAARRSSRATTPFAADATPADSVTLGTGSSPSRAAVATRARIAAASSVASSASLPGAMTRILPPDSWPTIAFESSCATAASTARATVPTTASPAS